jgi:non-specific serine/threonine protein kinase
MHKLDLETLSKERLQKAVDQEILDLGQNLYQQGLVLIQELTDLKANCVIQDIRNYHVQIKVSKSHIFFKCSCSHGSRGLICEHDVAAWLCIYDELEKKLPPVWRTQVNQVISSVQQTSRSGETASYALFFSLQHTYEIGSSTWSIQPYQLSWNVLIDEIAQDGVSKNSSSLATEEEQDAPANDSSDRHNKVSGMDQDLIAVAIERDPNLGKRAKPLYNPLDPKGCKNCAFASVNLANILIERQRTGALSENGGFLNDYLSLIHSTNSPLFIGDIKNPLRKRLQIIYSSGELKLELNKDAHGLQIGLLIDVGDDLIRLNPEDIQIVQNNPLWVLYASFLIRLDHPSALDLIATFRELNIVTIPNQQEQDFQNKYFLELARQFPLEGNHISWKQIQTEPVPRLYLSDESEELQVQLRFKYGDIELPYDHEMPEQSIRHEPDSWTLISIQRKPELEKEYFERLGTPNFGLKRAPHPARPGWFRLRARTHPVDFLLNTLPRLAKKGYELYGEEKLKTARVNHNKPTISFNVSSDIDWFDVKAVINFGELEVNLKEIRRVMRKQERFIRLPDGSIGEIPEEWFDRYKHVFMLGESKAENLRFSRYHIMLVDKALAQADQVQIDQKFEKSRQRLQALLDGGFKGIQSTPLPRGFTGDLRPYQKAGYEWLHFLYEYEFGGCLADDMGLGKTIQALAFLQSIYEEVDGKHPPEEASLLVVPRSLLINWQREAARFTPNLRILEYFNTDRVRDKTAFDQVDLVITTYGVMLRDIEFLHGYTFHYAVLDESQAIKNPFSQTARAAHLLQAKHHMVLTGTPIENSTTELWSQFAFLNPGLLGSLKYFKAEFGNPIEKKGNEEVAETLRELVFPFILRRTKDQVAPELPPRSERIVYSDMEPAQRKFYNRMRDYYRGLLLGMIESEGLDKSRIKILEGLLRLRQISNHPRLVDNKFRGASGKFELLFDTLETLRSEGHKALIFSQFVQMLSLVRKELDRIEVAYTYLDGSTYNRQEQVDTFQNREDIPFFLISLKAGGLGLNLTAADYVIHIDPWWNPAVEMQASDRTHRIGQDKPVFVYKLIARDSVEEKILVLQDRKKNLVDQIITTESSFFKNLTEEDIAVLFEN